MNSLQIKIYPLTYCPIDNIDRLHYTNKVILNRNILDYFNKKNLLGDTQFSVKLVHKTEYGEFNKICGIEEFSAPDGIGYMSLRLMEEMMLEIGDTVEIDYFSPPKGSFVLLKPLTKTFYSIQNIKEWLETNILYNYPILEKNTTIVIKDEQHNDIQLIIKDCKPYDIISTNNTDLEVDFEPCDSLTQNINNSINKSINNTGNNFSNELSNELSTELSTPTDKVVQEISANFKAFSGIGYSFSSNLNNDVNNDLNTRDTTVLNKGLTTRKKKKLVPKISTTSTFKAFSGIGNKLNG